MTMQISITAPCRSVELFQLAGRWRGVLLADEAMVEEKRDGWRAGHWRGLDGVPRLWTRNGHEIHGAGHILYRLAIMERIAGERMMFDGEFQVDGTLQATKAWCERGWKGGGEAGTLFLFDAIPESQWRAGGCDMPLLERKARLQALHDQAEAEVAEDWAWREGTRGREPNAPPTVVIPHDLTISPKGVQMMAEAVWARGGEGVMVKDPTAAYTRGRSDAWLKLKQGK